MVNTKPLNVLLEECTRVAMNDNQTGDDGVTNGRVSNKIN